MGMCFVRGATAGFTFYELETLKETGSFTVGVRPIGFRSSTSSRRSTMEEERVVIVVVLSVGQDKERPGKRNKPSVAYPSRSDIMGPC